MADPTDTQDLVFRGLKFVCVKPRVWSCHVTDYTELLLEKWTERINAGRQRDRWTCTVQGSYESFGRIDTKPESVVEEIFLELLKRQANLSEVVAAFSVQ